MRFCAINSLSLFKSTGAGASSFGESGVVFLAEVELADLPEILNSGAQLWVLSKSRPAIKSAVNNMPIKPTLTGK